MAEDDVLSTYHLRSESKMSRLLRAGAADSHVSWSNQVSAAKPDSRLGGDLGSYQRPDT